MKKTYKLKCIRRDKKYNGDICIYTVTPIQKGLNAIQTHLYNNNFERQVTYLAREVAGEEAIFTLQGRKKHIKQAIHTLLCDTNLPDYFKIEERE